MIQRIALNGLILLTLGGCAAAGPYDVNSPLYPVPAGSTLVLNQPLTIPANRVKVFMQNGRIVYAPNEYEPFCRFEILTLSARPQQVQSDSFEIFRSARVEDLFAFDSVRYQYAARRRLWLFNDDDPSPVIFGTRLYLRSARQPDVYRLMCGYLQERRLGSRHLSVSQMRAALGAIAELRLAGQ